LDLVPGAAAAYSLRSLSNSYADPVVTVRRSSDDAEEDFTASEVADGTLAAFCGAGDGFVYRWWDQSGNANHAVAAADANEPQIVDSGVVITEEGKPAIQFDGVDDYLTASGSVTGQTLLLLLNLTVYTANAVALSGATDFTFNLQYRGSDNFRSGLGDGTIFLNGAIAATYVGTAEFPLAIENQQVLITQIADAAETDATGIIFCRERTSATYQAARLQEILVYPSDLTAQRELIEGNIVWSYSV
jgi:hypothetical protein